MPAETRSKREGEASVRRPAASPPTIRAQHLARYMAGRAPVQVRTSTLRPAQLPIRSRTPSPSNQPSGAESSGEERGKSPAAAGGDPWNPSLVIGSSLGEDLSAVQLADRKIIQWRAVLKYHQENLPEATGPIQEILDAAIVERNQLDNSDANVKPKSALHTTARDAINDRLALLHSTLAKSTFAPEARNIRCAITGYNSGAITYSSEYTLIYAGRIVDTCPTYASFTIDRPSRLDRYAAAHGPGWLWFEPPLNVGDGSGGVELAKKAICLSNPPARRATISGNGFYDITMGFRRRIDFVSRGFVSHADSSATAIKESPALKRKAGSRHRDDVVAASEMTTSKDAGASGFQSQPGHPAAATAAASQQARISSRRPVKPIMVPDPTAPLLFFSMHLDSGASKPTLYAEDFRAMGIDTVRYSAQSAVLMQGVFEKQEVKMYEVDIGIYDGGGVPGAGNAVPARIWPQEGNTIGSMQPVLMLQGPAPAKPHPPDNSRLSGLLPFVACYLSSVPGSHRLWLGQDRRDVLGATRMPGQMRYLGFDPPGSSDKIENRLVAGGSRGLGRDLGAADRIVFDHDIKEDGTWLRDEDIGIGSSVITVNSKEVSGKSDKDKSGKEKSLFRPGLGYARQPEVMMHPSPRRQTRKTEKTEILPPDPRIYTESFPPQPPRAETKETETLPPNPRTSTSQTAFFPPGLPRRRSRQIRQTGTEILPPVPQVAITPPQPAKETMTLRSATRKARENEGSNEELLSPKTRLKRRKISKS